MSCFLIAGERVNRFILIVLLNVRKCPNLIFTEGEIGKITRKIWKKIECELLRQ